jgi:predicted membrane channel-forming protein YqfA (hemolysin III family)
MMGTSMFGMMGTSMFGMMGTSMFFHHFNKRLTSWEDEVA